MKLFAVHNDRASSDMDVLTEEAVGGFHSAGVVILADSMSEALSILRFRLGAYDHDFMRSAALREVSIEESGIVLFCDGEC